MPNGVLLTMPMMIDDQRWSSAAASRDDLANRRQVVGLEAAAERVGQQLFGERADEILPMAQQQRPQSGHALETGCRRAATPDASIGAPSLVVRHLPSASKFSSENPSGSIRT